MLYLIHIIYDDEKNQIRDDIERKEWRWCVSSASVIVGEGEDMRLIMVGIHYSVLCCRELDCTTGVRLNFRSAYIYFSICFRLGPKGLPHNVRVPWLMWDRKIPRHDQQPSHSSLVFWIWEFLLYSIRNYIHPYLEYIHPKTSCEFKSVHTNLLIGVFSCTFVFLFTDLSTLPYTLTAMWGHGVWLQMLPLMLLQIDAATTSNIWR